MGVFIIILLILNALASATYAIMRKKKGKEYFSALFFLFLPVMGFLLYFIPRVLFKLKDTQQYDRESLVKRFGYSKSEELPVLGKELNVVPILDAMAVSENEEKRELLLEELKKDLSSNYKVLLPAGKDSDSETAHYIAAAKMETYRTLQVQYQNAWKVWEQEKTEIALHDAFSALETMISSELLSGKEERLYKERYGKLFCEYRKLKMEFIGEDEITCMLIYLIELGKFNEAEIFYEENREKCRNERAYRKLLEMFYENRKKEKFYDTIKQLREDRQIKLSAQGLNDLRFWMNKEM